MITSEQLALCSAVGAAPKESPDDAKMGVARNVSSGIMPINGLRHPPTAGTSGWYIWAGGELSRDDDFFVAMHVRHMDELAPQITRFLALPPGWRFLVDGGYQDVWFDPSLLEV